MTTVTNRKSSGELAYSDKSERKRAFRSEVEVASFIGRYTVRDEASPDHLRKIVALPTLPREVHRITNAFDVIAARGTEGIKSYTARINATMKPAYTMAEPPNADGQINIKATAGDFLAIHQELNQTLAQIALVQAEASD